MCSSDLARAQETLDVILAEIDRLPGSITAEELDSVKARAKSGLVMQHESSAARTGSIARQWYHLGRLQPLADEREWTVRYEVLRFFRRAAGPVNPQHIAWLKRWSAEPAPKNEIKGWNGTYLALGGSYERAFQDFLLVLTETKSPAAVLTESKWDKVIATVPERYVREGMAPFKLAPEEFGKFNFVARKGPDGEVQLKREPIRELSSDPDLFATYNLQMEKLRIVFAGYCKAGPIRPPYNHMPEPHLTSTKENARRWRVLCDKYAGATKQ